MHSEQAKLLLQAFSAWIHICAVRLFVESILRYGLPPKFLAVLMKPNIKASSKLRKLLATLFNMPGEQEGAMSFSCIALLCVAGSIADVVGLTVQALRSTMTTKKAMATQGVSCHEVLVAMNMLHELLTSS